MSEAAEQNLVDRQRDLVAEFTELVKSRSETEDRIFIGIRSETEDAERELADTKRRLDEELAEQKQTLTEEYEANKQQVNDEYEAEKTRIEDEFRDKKDDLKRELDDAEAEAQRESKEAQWETAAVYEASKEKPTNSLRIREEQVENFGQELAYLRQDLADTLQKNRQYRELADGISVTAAAQQDLNPLAAVEQAVRTAQSQLVQLKSLSLPRFFQAAKAKAQFEAVYRPLAQALADAERMLEPCLAWARQAFETESVEVEDRRAKGSRKAEEKLKRRLYEIKSRREWVQTEYEHKYPRLLRDLSRRRDGALVENQSVYQQAVSEVQQLHDTEWKRHKTEYDTFVKKVTARYDAEFNKMSTRWQQGMLEFMSGVSQIEMEMKIWFPDWTDESKWDKWAPPVRFPPGIKIGEFPIDMDELPGGPPRDQRLRELGMTRWTLSGLLPFPRQSSVLITASNEGRDKGVEILQSLMLRLLTSIPPSKARFTIIDPVGLGQNFAAFMHLADYDEALVHSRIWTEATHIEQRLTDMTEQMESIIQKYLRNEFDTIEQYNAQAGEVAEPFRFLVVANFPNNFTEVAVRRLASIASTGARCGVYTLILRDRKQPLPASFDVKDLEAHAAHLLWKDDRFIWKGDFEPYPLTLDAPPDPEVCTQILKQVGEAARDAGKVEVPFERIAPPSEKWWSGSTAKELRVPLGPAGATKRQHMILGPGTAQHVLIAGKTGSGKSTLLHCLITNLALHYSPDEVELYLIDFKKGVEFKTYAMHELPHARVIAIESEREFGLSVLQRLDSELKARGDAFRELAVQDLAGYRTAAGKSLPRILLIIDEFQELFTEDDKLAQEASLLFDRLVRQGRAFGIHVLLGSQTLGGAYSLARSTVGQMTVRIALQCSETDAHLILSEDNTAARLLSRPGEAIYNDANGMLEGNHPFQVAWLDDDVREKYLGQLRDLAEKRDFLGRKPQIVFEGTAPSDLRKNFLLKQLVKEPTWRCESQTAHAWLGEAVAIKDPTAALLQRQGGANLLVVGQQEQPAAALLVSSMLSIAAQQTPELDSRYGASFYIFDGGPADAPNAGCLGGLAATLPHKFFTPGRRQIGASINELATEMARRQADPDGEYPSIYLFVYDIGRLRDLRKADDDFGFGRVDPDAPPDPAKQFGDILREGPDLGIHTLVWCDTVANLSRTFDRQTQREFELRVLFQMSPSDSSHLLDTPDASKLGLHRAIFSSEDQGIMEKFRPYALPDESWLIQIGSRLKARPVQTPKELEEGV